MLTNYRIKNRYWGLLLWIFVCFPGQAQEIDLRNTEWQNYLEEMADQEDADQAAIELLYEELSLLSESPFNINTLKKEELERLPFLSDRQIEDILYYLYKYGPVLELSELKNIESLDWQSVRYLLPFLYPGKPEEKNPFQWKNLLRYAQQEVLLRSDYGLQQKEGYRKKEEGENSADRYVGEPYYLSVRYAYKYREKLHIGIAGEKDAGEPFLSQGGKGFDHYAFNLNIKDEGILKDLHLGDYRLSYGEGLALNTQFSTGKTSDITSLGQRYSGIKRHASPNENNYFRGIAAQFQIKSLRFAAFGSYRRHDANADSASIYTFKTDGYNRTEKEREKQGKALIRMFGGNIEWKNENLRIGVVSALYSFGGKKTDPEPHPYNLYYLREKEHGNTGIYYYYQDRQFIFRGETAIDKNGKWANLNHLMFQPRSSIGFSLSFRHYPKDYNAFFGKAFGEASSVQNESGVYTGIRIRPNGRWEFSSYIDYFRFPWLRYGINSPSSGRDFLFGLIYRRNSSSHFQFRYKFKEKAKNQISDDGRSTSVLAYRQHRFRQQFHYSAGEKFSAKLQADYTLYEGTNDQIGSAWSFSQNFSFIPDKEQVQWDSGIAYFRTGDWNTRITVYEKSILYAFSFPSYYGEGLRFYSVLKWKATKDLTWYMKFGHTHYFDRIKVGSGLDEIEGSAKSDVSVLLKVRF